MKKTIRMNERELHRMISEAVKRVVNEGGKKHTKSFKSKEDMSKYRDLYSPYDTETIIDTDGSIYDSNQEEVGKWGNGPYKGYIRHTFADGYDYCGDDDYNAYAMKYNDALRKRLATKGGQMSYDWEHRFDNDDSYWTPEQIKRYEKDLRGTRDYENQLNNVIGKLKRDDYIHDENNNCDWFEKELKRVRNSYNRFSNM